MRRCVCVCVPQASTPLSCPVYHINCDMRRRSMRTAPSCSSSATAQRLACLNLSDNIRLLEVIGLRLFELISNVIAPAGESANACLAVSSTLGCCFNSRGAVSRIVSWLKENQEERLQLNSALYVLEQWKMWSSLQGTCGTSMCVIISVHAKTSDVFHASASLIPGLGRCYSYFQSSAVLSSSELTVQPQEFVVKPLFSSNDRKTPLRSVIGTASTYPPQKAWSPVFQASVRNSSNLPSANLFSAPNFPT